MNQVELILRHLTRHGSISQSEARQIYNVNRLPSRIHDIRKLGHKVVSVMKQDPMGRSYARYMLEA